MDTVRILRIVEYTGPRDQVEAQVQKSIHGERRVNEVVIRAATIGEFPEILGNPDPLPPAARAGGTPGSFRRPGAGGGQGS